MKNKTFITLSTGMVLGIVLLFTACGGGSGSSSSAKKLPTHEVFGDILDIANRYHYTDSVREAECVAKIEKLKLKGLSESSVQKITALRAQRKQDEKNSKAELEEAIAKEKSNVIGKKVPFEVEEGLGYEVTDFTVVDVEKDGDVSAKCQLKITDAKAADIIGGKLFIEFDFFDKDGNSMGKKGAAYVKLPEAADGATASQGILFNTSSNRAKKYVNFAKVKFLKENG